jgi:hypothetical protein
MQRNATGRVPTSNAMPKQQFIAPVFASQSREQRRKELPNSHFIYIFHFLLNLKWRENLRGKKSDSEN